MSELTPPVSYQSDGRHLTVFFRQLSALPDTAEQPDDSIEIKTAKARVLLQRLNQALLDWSRPGIRFIEQAMCDRLRVIDNEEIWKAIDEDNSAQVRALNAEHKGIVEFFRQFNKLPDQIEMMQTYLQQLTGTAPDNPADTGELY